MDTENEHLLVQEAGAALAKAMKWVICKTEENRRQEEDVPARAQAVSCTRPCWMPIVLFLAVILMSSASNGSSRQTCLFLSANVSTWRPEAEFLRDIDADSEEWNSQYIILEWRAQIVGLCCSITCHGVHDLVKMCHLVNLIPGKEWPRVCERKTET